MTPSPADASIEAQAQAQADAASPLCDPLAWLDAWRARQGDGLHPVQAAVAQAMARRAAGQQGLARERLVQRLQALLDAPPCRSHAVAAPADQAAPAEGLAALASLVDRLGRTGPPWHADSSASASTVGRVRPASRPPAPAPLKSVAAFQGTWSRLRVEQRLRQALAQVPAAAGPLNSAQLVSRALHAMRKLSPEYLDAFMSHVDTLLWLERVSGLGDVAPRAASPARAEQPRRRAPGKAARKG